MMAELVLDSETHVYRVGNREIPSVTKVLDAVFAGPRRVKPSRALTNERDFPCSKRVVTRTALKCQD